MSPRIDFRKASPGAALAMSGLEKHMATTTVEKPLYELVKIRSSQINACAFCLDMHTKDARALGESEQRIYGLSAWREAPFYTPRERAALAWTEALTLILAKLPKVTGDAQPFMDPGLVKVLDEKNNVVMSDKVFIL